MAISIRCATPSDADHIAQLTGQLGYDVGSADVATRLSRILSKPDQRLLIAEIDGQPVGWLHVAMAEYIEADPFVLIAGIVVDARYRRKGIGAALLRYAEEWAQERQCSLLRLWSTVTRTSAHRFYERLGFTKVKTQHSFVKAVGDAAPDLTKCVPRVDD